MQVKEEEDEEKMFEASCGNPSFTITMRKSHCSKNELVRFQTYFIGANLGYIYRLIRGSENNDFLIR